ncbi:P-type E1-E2 ATPase [Georgenia soli]|uniref:P-type E1-E2 ATPase n=1 Tax=Georgenia soli TaxID=638953 RepID=A0A2A9EPG3_9MICO|nr:cation-transporting P-type ATPase [Georgenia soli]PFG40162.1 P-type E1-E2 ATPase [Georgenia soli]
MGTPSAQGLSAEEAAQRLAADGPNVLPHPRPRSLVRRIVAQLTHFFALLLWFAATLAGLAGMPQLTVAIVAVVALNATFSVIQESRAGRAAERLRALLPARVNVRRGGRPVVVDATEVVRGDVLLLAAGDRVPADGQVLAGNGLLLDTSMLTGESEPAAVDDGAELFAGTFVVEGEADTVVTATGEGTRLAAIARLTAAADEPVTPLTRELRRVVRTISLVALGVGGSFYAVALLLGMPTGASFVLGIGVTVALVPEGLLPTVTLALAIGAERMARRNVLVRNLEAVETLGSVTHICTDKTGTLTQNQMTVVAVWTAGGTATTDVPGYDPRGSLRLSAGGSREAVLRAARTAVLCSDGHVRQEDGRWVAHGDPMEAALDVLARRAGVDTDAVRADGARARFPFDPRRRRMSVVADGHVHVKGAPDAVLPLCRGGDDGAAAAALHRLTARGLRVLAVAGTAVTGVPATADQAERDLELYGLLGLEDPPRTDVGEALDACRRAGVTVVMVTGDHPATAVAIADEVGLHRPGAPVVTGDELPADDGELGRLLERPGAVVARVTPEQKLRIARVLRSRGHVVAMTGDGVNDGPALHEADIGVAMGASGTDVAREASDLVILDDHFASIVAGVEQGRATYVNIRRFLTYHLTDNVAELAPFVAWALTAGNLPLALGVLQILAIDVGTDTISAVALGAEPPSRGLLAGPPVTGALFNGSVARRAFGVLGPVVALGSMTAFVLSLLGSGWRFGGQADPAALAAASGAAFLTVVVSQAANAFVCRSFTVTPFRLGWGTNRWLPPAVAASLVLSLVLLGWPAVAREMGHTWPGPVGVLVALATAAATLGVDALDKAARARRRRGLARPPASA